MRRRPRLGGKCPVCDGTGKVEGAYGLTPRQLQIARVPEWKPCPECRGDGKLEPEARPSWYAGDRRKERDEEEMV